MKKNSGTDAESAREPAIPPESPQPPKKQNKVNKQRKLDPTVVGLQVERHDVCSILKMELNVNTTIPIFCKPHTNPNKTQQHKQTNNNDKTTAVA